MRRGEAGQVGRRQPVLGEQQGAQLVGVERAGVGEDAAHLLADGVVALDHLVEDVADRDHRVDGEGVALAHQQLLHHLQRGPVPLHGRGQRAQRGHQGGGEGVGTPERLLVRAAVGLAGVDPVEQHVPHLRAPLEPGEGVVQGGPRGFAGRLEESLLGDVGQVVIAEGDGGEPALLVAEGVVQRVLLGSHAAGFQEVPAQVQLPGDDADQRDRPLVLRLDELGDLLRLPGEERRVAHLERQPQHQLVAEQGDRVVAEAAGVRADRCQSLVQGDEAGGVGVGGEIDTGPDR